MKILKEIGGFIVLSGPLFPLLVYFILAIVVSIVATVKGARRGRKRWGIYSFLIFFLVLFWETPLVLHQYRDACENQAGFVVHKTLDQWKQENPGVAETLDPEKFPEQYFTEAGQIYPGQKSSGLYRKYRYPNGAELTVMFLKSGKFDRHRFSYPGIAKNNARWMNERFAWVTEYHQGFVVRQLDERIIDLETGEVIAQYTDFAGYPPWRSRGDWFLLNPQNWKFWLRHGSCERSDRNHTKPQMYTFNRLKTLFKYQYQKEY